MNFCILMIIFWNWSRRHRAYLLILKRRHISWLKLGYIPFSTSQSLTTLQSKTSSFLKTTYEFPLVNSIFNPNKIKNPPVTRSTKYWKFLKNKLKRLLEKHIATMRNHISVDEKIIAAYTTTISVGSLGVTNAEIKLRKKNIAFGFIALVKNPALTDLKAEISWKAGASP